MTVKILNHCLLRLAKGVVESVNAQGIAAALVAEDEVRTITLIDSQVSQYFLSSDLAQCCPCYSYVNVQKMPKQIIYSHLLSYANAARHGERNAKSSRQGRRGFIPSARRAVGARASLCLKLYFHAVEAYRSKMAKKNTQFSSKPA